MSKKKFNREEWLEKPFETVEGIVEVWIHDPIYRINVHLITNCAGDKSKQWMKRVMDIEDDAGHPKHLAGCCSEIKNKYDALFAIVISMPDKWNGDELEKVTLMHECYHVASYTLFSRGLKHTYETEEAFAYFHESLYRRFLDAMKLKVLKYKR